MFIRYHCLNCQDDRKHSIVLSQPKADTKNTTLTTIRCTECEAKSRIEHRTGALPVYGDKRHKSQSE